CVSIVDGPTPIWPASIAIRTEEEGRRAVRLLKRRGADFVKVYSLIPRQAYFAIADEAKRQGLPFAGHVPIDAKVAEASDAGQTSIEHIGTVNAAEARDELFGRLARNGTWFCPTLVLAKSLEQGDSVTPADARLKYVARSMQEAWAPLR